MLIMLLRAVAQKSLKNCSANAVLKLNMFAAVLGKHPDPSLYKAAKTLTSNGTGGRPRVLSFGPVDVLLHRWPLQLSLSSPRALETPRMAPGTPA